MTIGDFESLYGINQQFLLGTSCMLNSNLLFGVLGLGFNSSTGSSSFVQNFKTLQVIQNAVFSIYLSDIGFNGEKNEVEQSMLMVGDWDLQTYAKKPENGLFYHSVVGLSENQWILKLTQVRWSSFRLGIINSVIIDPGQSFVYAPSYIITAIYNEISETKYCSINNNATFECTCSGENDFPTIYVVIDSREYSIESKRYVYYESGICQVYLYESVNQNAWILGQIFLRKYYSVWDFDNKTIGFALSINYSSGSSGGGSNHWVIILVVVLSVCVTVGVSLVVLYCYRRKRNREEVKHNENIKLIEKEMTIN
jgi:hypothetical protein